MVTDPPRNYDCAPAVAPRIGLFYLRISHHLTKKQDCPTAFELGSPQMPLGCWPSKFCMGCVVGSMHADHDTCGGLDAGVTLARAEPLLRDQNARPVAGHVYVCWEHMAIYFLYP